MQIQTHRKEGRFETTVSFFGKSCDTFLFLRAGLVSNEIDADIFDLGEYSINKDPFTRHIVFTTTEAPNESRYIDDGRALFEYLAMAERHQIVIGEEIIKIISSQLPQPVPILIQ